VRRPATIVHIAWLSQVGGGELFLLDLLDTFDKERFAHELFCLGPGGELQQMASNLGLRVLQFPKKTKLGPVTVLRLAAALRRSRPDIVQTHGEAGVFWGITATRLARTLTPAWTPALCSLVYQNYRETRGKMYTMRRLLPRADLVIAGSEGVRSFLVGEVGVHRSRSRVIHCGIDPRSFEADAPTAHGHHPVDRQAGSILVTVGRLVERKGHAFLLQAFRQVLTTHSDAELWIVGEGPERGKLRHLANKLRIEQRVRFLGTVYPTGSILRQADLFVFPSLIEPQGLALLEAFAAGVPVVASRTGGIVEMLEDGKDGSLVEPGDPDALAKAIAELLADPGKRQTCARNAKRRVQDFDIRLIARRYEKLYDALIHPDDVSTGDRKGGS